jgi:hypothetical protein
MSRFWHNQRQLIPGKQFIPINLKDHNQVKKMYLIVYCTECSFGKCEQWELPALGDPQQSCAKWHGFGNKQLTVSKQWRSTQYSEQIYPAHTIKHSSLFVHIVCIPHWSTIGIEIWALILEEGEKTLPLEAVASRNDDTMVAIDSVTYHPLYPIYTEMPKSAREYYL